MPHALQEDRIDPIVNVLLIDEPGLLEEVDRVEVLVGNGEDTVHAAVVDKLFKGTNRGNHRIGIGLVAQREMELGRVAEALFAFVLNGMHVLMILNRVGLELTHAILAVGT
jgi:hypothetical protein